MNAGRVICISRNSNIQMYESLVELLRLLGDMGFKVEVICPAHDFADDPVWTHPAVSYCFLPPSERPPRVPMTGRLLFRAVRSAMTNQPSLIVGADGIGSILAAMVSRVVRVPLLYYGLELPHARRSPLPWPTRMEHWSIRKADLIITMDQQHADFIRSQTGVDAGRMALLPNAAIGGTRIIKSDYLRKRYPACAGNVLAIHAGGIGQAQQSLDLAQAAERWGPDKHLVFHAHCRMDKEGYFQNFAQQIPRMTRVHLNNEPVSPEALDNVISSADIGIAWYDRKFLGYRADLLGLAPGKIGRYLRNGVPVVVTNLPTVREYVDAYRCGICVDSLGQIGAAIDTIMSDYDQFRGNAIRCFEELWQPEPYLEQLKVRIQGFCTR